MTQSLERAGDHAKNLAEEVCHLVSGHSVRHVLRAYDKPVEQMFIEDLKRRQKIVRCTGQFSVDSSSDSGRLHLNLMRRRAMSSQASAKRHRRQRAATAGQLP